MLRRSLLSPRELGKLTNLIDYEEDYYFNRETGNA